MRAPYRNRRVGDLLRQIDLAEEARTGIPTTFEAMKRNGSPRPRFETDEDRTYFTAILPVHPAFLKGNSETRMGGGNEKTPPMQPPMPTREREILKFCRQPRKRAEIQKYLGLKDGQPLRNRYLRDLIARELLFPTDPENLTNNDLKYQITKKGEVALASSAPTQTSLFD